MCSIPILDPLFDIEGLPTGLIDQRRNCLLDCEGTLLHQRRVLSFIDDDRMKVLFVRFTNRYDGRNSLERNGDVGLG